MRSSLLGLVGPAGDTLSEGYIKVDTSIGSLGAGIVSETMQFHGTADLYTVAADTDTAVIATLYSSSTAPTPSSNPAVTSRLVGPNGGSASAFVYDLAESIILTRQGNPAWVNQNRDEQTGPNRPDDLFFGAMTGDVQPDYVDRTKIAIPQADEQQRLLVNLMTQRASDRLPLPRLWYLPNGHKAVIVMTSDNHGGGSIVGRFEQELNASPPGCRVEDWQCVRSTTYLYPAASELTDAQARMYEDLGYEVAVHPNTNCESVPREKFAAILASDLEDFAQRFPSLNLTSSPIVTERTHCAAWTDYTTVPEELLQAGIHLDTNYYYWPPGWVNDRPGLFTGTGFAQRFATTTGQLIDVYQATTQMTDESGMSFPATAIALMDRALGPEAYYGTFVANIHSDHNTEAINRAIIQAAQARNVPVISARQLLTWLDGRGASSFSDLNWDDATGTFTFTLTVAAGARGLEAMVPMQLIIPSTESDESGIQIRTLESLSGPDGPLPTLTPRTVKGIDYAVLSAVSGQWTATYSASTTPPPPPSQVSDTSVSDFSQGTSVGSDVEIRSDIGDGALSLPRLFTRLDFDSTELPSGWSARAEPWDPSKGGTASISDGSLHVDGTVVFGPSGQYSAIEFQAAFGGSNFQYVGLAADSDVTNPWFNVGIGGQMDQVYARRTIDTSQSMVDVGLGADLLNVPHIYRIEWTPAEVRWYVDGVLRHTDTAIATATAQMSLVPTVSEFNFGDGVALVVDFIQTEQYPAPSTGSFHSRVFDAGQGSSFDALTLTTDATTPTGSTLQTAVRTGDTTAPDATWSPFVPVTQGQVTSVPAARYAQYQLQLSTTDKRSSPIVRSVNIEF